ncbi:MAG: hypothetical protein L0Z51_08415 [Candidatus Latescibacteria bacterium]|nr:hypothetical protein [Candidatus Latescibacterota bacterium]
MTASLSWTGDDPDAIDEIYDVYFGTTNPSPFVGTVTEERYYYSNLPFTTTFYWRIEARDAHGAATWGPTWMFMRGRYLFCPNGSHMAMYDDQARYMDGVIRFIYEVDAGTMTPPKK